MLTQHLQKNREQIEMITLEQLVPKTTWFVKWKHKFEEDGHLDLGKAKHDFK